VKGSVCGVEVWITIDTGASRTIVSKRVFEEIQHSQPTELNKKFTRSLTQADGNVLEEFGTSELQFMIESVQYDKQVAIANISDDVLLGLDFGTMDILSSESAIVLNQHKFSATIVPATGIRQVQATETLDIPAMSEAIIPVQIVKNGEVEDSKESHIVIIEPDNKLVEKYSALMAASLVNAANEHTIKVRIMNSSVGRGN
jgi:hypothetical protein